jgi:hypothetical protein
VLDTPVIATNLSLSEQKNIYIHKNKKKKHGLVQQSAFEGAGVVDGRAEAAAHRHTDAGHQHTLEHEHLHAAAHQQGVRQAVHRSAHQKHKKYLPLASSSTRQKYV